MKTSRNFKSLPRWSDLSWGLTANMRKEKASREETDDGDFPILQRFVKREGNHVYLYDSIDNETQLMTVNMLRMAIRDIMTEHVGELLSGELSDAVTLHINSPGGFAMCGFALYDFIKSSQIPIVGVVEGECCSAATLPLLACSTRLMSPNSVVLLHQLSWGDWGKNDYMQDQARNSEYLMEKLRGIYLEETTIGSQLEGDKRVNYLQGLLEHDLYLGLEDCKKYGIVNQSDDDNLELSEERGKQLQGYIEKLFEEQKKENERIAKKEQKAANEPPKIRKRVKKSETATPVKKAPAKTKK